MGSLVGKELPNRAESGSELIEALVLGFNPIRKTLFDVSSVRISIVQ